MGFLFSANGRISRQTYITWSVLLFVSILVISFFAGFFAGLFGVSEDANSLIGLVVVIAIAHAIPQIFLTVKRLHDIGKPGSHFFLFLVPFYSSYLSLVLLFAKGHEGDNRYGPDPTVA